MTAKQLHRLVTRASLVLAPLLWLGSALAASALPTDETAQVAAIGRHPDRYYLFTLLTLVGTALLVPALVALSELARERAPWPTIVGAGLAQLGALVGVADSGTQLVYWQMGAPGADREQMAALAQRSVDAPGASVVFMLGGLSIVAGSVLLALGLRRAAAAPGWAIACLPVGIVANIVAFAAGSRPLLAVSGVVLLAGLGRIAAGRGGTIPAADRVESQVSLS